LRAFILRRSGDPLRQAADPTDFRSTLEFVQYATEWQTGKA
jgi:hypothetical protein